MDYRWRPLTISGIHLDITERKRSEEDKKKLEAQLQQAQKMEAIGTLAGGIAHQFNNALAGIIGYVDLMGMVFSNDKNLDKYVDGIKNSSFRMAKLAQQLLSYATGGKYNEQMVSANDLIRDTLPLIKHTVDQNIHIDTDIPVDVFSLKVDITQMQTVLSAIIANASEAIEGKGRIKVICKNKVISDKESIVFPDLKPGNYVCIRIEDDGKGMDEETKSRIFEPFFTTKFTGRGLGMAAVYGIIKNHNGAVIVDSKLGEGTRVSIYLPTFKTDAGVKKELIIETLPSKETGTIFVIEDEKLVADLIKAQLEALGYRVLSAVTGKEAIEFAKTFDGDIDLVILDMILPDMGGKDIYKGIMKARPDMKVIICSGYSIDEPAREILDDGADYFIQKPFRMAELSGVLKKSLGKD